MTKETQASISFWSNILVTLLTIVLVILSWRHPTYSPQAFPPSHAQAQHALVQPLGQVWREWLRVLSPYIAVTMLLFVALLNLKGAKHLRAARATDRREGENPIQGDSRSQGAGNPPRPIQTQQLVGGKITAGSKVRLRRPSDVAERQRDPKWIPEMDRYVGSEFIVSSCESNGFLQLEGLRYCVHISWVEQVS